jgi:sugar lactone lactonase YvrE
MIVFLALAIAAPQSVQAETKVAVQQKGLLDYVRETRAARLAGNHRAWREGALKTLELAPQHPDLLISAARAHAATGDEASAFAFLAQATRRGAGFDPLQLPEFKTLQTMSGFDHLTRRMRANAVPVPHAKVFSVLPRKDSQSEGIAYDPVSKRLFTGSMQGEIFAIDRNGNVKTFVAAGSGLREVLGLKVDASRRLLWAATGVFPDLIQSNAPPKPDVGITGFFAFRLDDGGLVAAHWLEDKSTLHGFNDLALAANGDVYVTDSPTGAVYVLREGEKTIQLFVRDRHISFPNGIVMLPDQQRLVVAHVEGLSRIDLATRAVRRLDVPDNESVNSIDGLAFDRGTLIGVQGSPYLSRVVRITLDGGASAVTSVVILNSHTPREYNQTTAAVAGDQLYVIAGTPAADAAGAPLAKEPQPQVLRIPLG